MFDYIKDARTSTHDAALRFALSTGLQLLEQLNDCVGAGFIDNNSGEVIRKIKIMQ